MPLQMSGLSQTPFAVWFPQANPADFGAFTQPEHGGVQLAGTHESFVHTFMSLQTELIGVWTHPVTGLAAGFVGSHASVVHVMPSLQAVSSSFDTHTSVTSLQLMCVHVIASSGHGFGPSVVHICVVSSQVSIPSQKVLSGHLSSLKHPAQRSLISLHCSGGGHGSPGSLQHVSGSAVGSPGAQ